MTRAKPKTRRETKKERALLEKQFLSAVLADIDFADIRQAASRYPGLAWRHFVDVRHQALWRAVQEIDLSNGTEERIAALMAERGLTADDTHDNLGLCNDLAKESEGAAWLEHELAAAGALPSVGGKVYLREVCEAYPAALAADGLARRLGFA
jgi:hypothetical protein